VDTAEFCERILDPGLQVVRDVLDIPISSAARRLLLATAIQESGLRYRYQLSRFDSVPGPARGWWQFEVTGVAGVLRHARSAKLAQRICEHYGVEPQSTAVWRALEGHDGLAVAFARLLYFTDPDALPQNSASAWNYYLRNWRPGKPTRARWYVTSWTGAVWEAI
jgi:hypothetical protein